jgi:hypothetical protein
MALITEIQNPSQESTAVIPSTSCRTDQVTDHGDSFNLMSDGSHGQNTVGFFILMKERSGGHNSCESFNLKAERTRGQSRQSEQWDITPVTASKHLQVVRPFPDIHSAEAVGANNVKMTETFRRMEGCYQTEIRNKFRTTE